MTEVSYRQQWADGEIEDGTLLDAIDALRAENERLKAFFTCCERIVEQLEDSPKSAFKRLRDAVKEVENAR